ncbi:MAG: 4Fe-4S ferredoxin, partial [Nitrospirota bacterium]|nr:4Fe-4S ferredoxin [Nitrospirota bacterium]
GDLSRSLREDVQRAAVWKRRLPRIYNLIAFPLITRHLKKVHFGQIVPVEDVERILDRFSTVVRLPCVCRKASTGRELRYCFGIGMDLTPVYRDIPDMSSFERLPAAEAKAFIRRLDSEGKSHSIWTLGTPFIGGLCNCDQDCMAFRFDRQMKLGKAMWKAEYVSSIAPGLCTGCRECMKRCIFDSIRYDRKDVKCTVDPYSCYGCGVCRTVCQSGAISLIKRDTSHFS